MTSYAPRFLVPLALALVPLLGCPADDGGDDGAAGSSSTGTAPPDTSTGTPDTTTGTPPATSDGSSGSDGGTTAGTDSSGSSDGGESSGSTGEEVCMINLPPPPACPAQNEPPPPNAVAPVVIPGDWPTAGAPIPVSVTAPEDPDFGGFIDPPDGGGTPFECDTFTQDCGPGEKCMPWANDGGGSWNATRCSPIAAMPGQVGDPCMVEGSGVSGIDDCDIGTMCWDVDPATNQGECIELCSCSPANPVCNTPNTTCAISNDGALAVCLPVCNPLDPATCGMGLGCYPLGDIFLCAPDASGDAGMPGDPCQFINTCEPGTFCLGGAQVPGCGGAGCCTSACTVGDDSPCLAGQTCQAWYQPGEAPDACLGTVGACVAM